MRSSAGRPAIASATHRLSSFPAAASSGPGAGSTASGASPSATLGTPAFPSRRTDRPQFQAIFRSHGPNGLAGSYDGSDRYNRTNVSCAASSASAAFPVADQQSR